MTDKQTKDITFGEFQHWMSGLIEGKRGQLPDADDWKRIKSMMDRVKPDVETVTLPSPAPYIPPYNNPWFDRGPSPAPYIPPYNNPWFDRGPSPTPVEPIWPDTIWCGSSTSLIGTVTSGIETGNGYSVEDLKVDFTDSLNKLKTME